MADTNGERSRLEWTFKVGFAVVVLLLIVTASVQVGFVRAGTQRTSDVAEAQDEIRFAQSQADRNLVVQACTTSYAATATSWEDEADRLEARVVQQAVDGLNPDPELSARSVQAADNAAEMNRRRLGLSELARDEAGSRSGGFACPAIPARLRIDPVDPTDPAPPR